MKRWLILLLASCAFAYAAGPKKQQLVGKWSFVSSSGGFTGKGTGWNPADRICFEFKANGQFRHYVKGKLRASDRYRITDRIVQNEETVKKIIDFERNIDQFYQIRSDTLYLTEDVRDGFSYVLVRKK